MSNDPLVVEFAQVAHTLGRRPQAKAAREIYKRFGIILKSYNTRGGPAGRAALIGGDFYKFLGHELFVILFSVLLRREHWDEIADLLRGGLYKKEGQHQVATTAPFYHLSKRVQLLDVRGVSPRDPHLKPNTWALHAQVLEDRHTQGRLADLAPFPLFAAADYLLFLRTLLQPAKVVKEERWTPWSALSIPDTPQFLVEAVYKHYAQQLLEPLGVETVEVLRARLLERPRTLDEIFDRHLEIDRLSWFDPRTLGTM